MDGQPAIRGSDCQARMRKDPNKLMSGSLRYYVGWVNQMILQLQG